MREYCLTGKCLSFGDCGYIKYVCNNLWCCQAFINFICQNISITWFRNNTGVTGTGNLSRFWNEVIKPGFGYPV